MQPKTVFAAPAIALALMACVPDLVTEPPVADSCNAVGNQTLIGQEFASTTLPDKKDIRIVGPDIPVTADFLPTRMNIWVDKDGTITRVYCG